MDQERVNESLWGEIRQINSRMLWKVSYGFAVTFLATTALFSAYVAWSLSQAKADIRSLKEQLLPYSIEYKG